MRNFVQNVPCRDLGLLISFVLFYDGPNWSPKLCTIFEVDTFSHNINSFAAEGDYSRPPGLTPLATKVDKVLSLP